MVPRKKAKYFWARDTVDNAGPAGSNPTDLLAGYKASFGLVFNLPDIVIWRVIIKISIDIHLSAAAYTSTSGVDLGIYVDDSVQTQEGDPITNRYGEKYMMWDKLFLSEPLSMGLGAAAVTSTNVYQLYKFYDIKSRRKMQPRDTLWLEMSNQGNVVMDQFSLFYSVLLRLP